MDAWVWLIKLIGNYESWPGLTYNNAIRYCPSADETIKCHMVKTRQGVLSTKPKQPRSPKIRKERKSDIIRSQFIDLGYGTNQGGADLPAIYEPTPWNDSVNELYVRVLNKKKLYTDDTRRFPIRARSGNQYVMVAWYYLLHSLSKICRSTRRLFSLSRCIMAL